MLGKLAVTAVIGMGLAVGLLWPTPSSAPGVGEELVISRSSDKHYYADASVNGRPVQFMVDTGAEQIALTEADARSVGLAVDPSRYEVVGDGASGIVLGQHVQLRTLELNGHTAQNVDAVVVKGASVSLLGQAFLETLDEILIRKNQMRLRFARSIGLSA